MPAPAYPAIKGTTSGTPGTGAFTPNAAYSGYRAWSNVPTGWMGLVLFQDGPAWELSYCYWNGTTLSRGTNQRFDSSTGSVLSLTSAATAALVEDPLETAPTLLRNDLRAAISNLGGTTFSLIGAGTPTALGTPAGSTSATTNLLTMQPRIQFTSATTANAQAGIHHNTGAQYYSTTAGLGGFLAGARFGATQLPTGPRLFVGQATSTYGGSTGEPSALAASIAAFAKDSTDTNIQLLTKDGTTANKVDTGIPFATNGWYDARVWAEPGGGRIYGRLFRLDTGDIWYGSTTTNLPADGSLMRMMVIGGLSSTTGTAMIFHTPGFGLRYGF
jgi:hypothetical protein